MKDSIVLIGLEVVATHGVLPAERTDPQRFVIDISVEINLARPGATDDLADTLDYGDLAQRAHDLVSGTSFHLIERLADQLAAMVLEDERVSSVLVTVHKPEAPISVPFHDVSVTVHRGR
ncbi:MAG: dihydroneopterin aldolase [Acidimicrobiia bacterium]|nr:dihydroneopterin aldolase [Acidimicrobiia bacterium]MDH3462708.1 dihydroneopterin aldolase [Acidimicrobiia bacterium]